MAIQYAGGTTVNTTFTNTTGTRREIVDGLVAALTSAGWSVRSGSGTGDVQMLSVATPIGSQYVVRVYDAGSGTSARLQLKNAGATVSMSDYIYLVASPGKTWRVIANKYQFFIFVPGSNQPREFAMASAPYVPPFLTTVTSTFFMLGQSKSDTDTSVTAGMFRSSMSSFHSNFGAFAGQALFTNNQMVDFGAGAGGGSGQNIGIAHLYVPCQPVLINPGSTYIPYQSTGRYTNFSYHISDPLVSYATHLIIEEPTIKGQMWDSIVVSDNLPGDCTFSYDGQTFWNLTINNLQTRHSFLILVP